MGHATPEDARKMLSRMRLCVVKNEKCKFYWKIGFIGYDEGLEQSKPPFDTSDEAIADGTKSVRELIEIASADCGETIEFRLEDIFVN